MGFKRNKIAIIGAGATGSTIALMLAQLELGDIVLLDIPSNLKRIKGIALDISQITPIQYLHTNIQATSNYEDIENVDIVIITAGFPRKPGMDRKDLLDKNSEIMSDISENIKKYAPNSFVIILSNPVDVMTYLCLKNTQFPNNKVIGQSGVLDTARFKTFIAMELNVSVQDISSFVLGGHGDEMVPMIRYTSVGGIPLEKILPKPKINELIERTRKGGAEIVELLGNGSAFYAPAASVVEMVDAIVNDKKRIIPSIAYLNGEYGYSDICLGVPTILGANGIENVIEIPLTDHEKMELHKSYLYVKEMIDLLK